MAIYGDILLPYSEPPDQGYKLQSSDTGVFDWVKDSGRNLIINGDFNSWQEGTSFAAIANLTHVADLWIYNESGDMVHTINRSGDVPTVAESGHLSNYCLQIDCTTIDGSLAASEYTWVEHKIEGYNFQRIAQKEFTVSFWHKHTKTGTYCVSLINSGQDRSYVAEYTQAVTDTWEKSTITVSASPSAGTWDYENGTGIRLLFTLASGTTFHATAADTWETGVYIATSNQVNACDNTANNFQIAQVQVELGSVATQFESEPIQQTLAKIYRYFYRIDESATGGEHTFIASGVYASTTTDYRGVILFPVQMRDAPTMADSGDTDFSVSSSATETVSSGLQIDGATINSCRIKAVTSVAAAGYGGLLFIENATGGYMQFNARL